jgi:hypothetical protein
MFVLRRATGVSPDPERGIGDHRTHILPAGTRIEEIPESELAQLAPAHFAAVDDATRLDDLAEVAMAVRVAGPELPDDWRTNEVTLAHDRRQDRAQRAEAKERAKRKAAKNELWQEG